MGFIRTRWGERQLRLRGLNLKEGRDRLSLWTFLKSSALFMMDFYDLRSKEFIYGFHFVSPIYHLCELKIYMHSHALCVNQSALNIYPWNNKFTSQFPHLVVCFEKVILWIQRFFFFLQPNLLRSNSRLMESDDFTNEAGNRWIVNRAFSGALNCKYL